MTGIPTQFAIADLVLEARRAAGQPVPADADLPFFYLGAVGAKLGDFLPSKVEFGTAEPNSRIFAAWLPILRVLAGGPGIPGLYANLSTLRERLDLLRRLSKQADLAAKFEVLANKSKFEELRDIVDALGPQLAAINGLRNGFLGDVLAVGGRAGAGPKTRWKIRPATWWRVRDTLHGSRTGRFMQELRRRANSSGDSQLKAYADGAMVAFAAQVTGNPFLNRIVGAPHRNHWWRHQWISNHVDTWVWGYVEKRRKVRASGREIVYTMAGLVPNPPLPTWDNVVGADLQRRIAIGGINETVVLNAIAGGTPLPAHLPTKLVTLWLDSYTAAHGAPPATVGVDAAGVQSAFSLTWLTLWIATSAGFLGAAAPEEINLPDSCGDKPDWVEVDGSVVLPGGQIISPPDPPMGDPSWVEVASAIAVVLLAGINYAFGNVAGGAALLASAVALLDDATPPDWDALSCHSEWVAVFLTTLHNHLRELLVTAGLAPPYTSQLDHNPIAFSAGKVEPTNAALNTCRTPSDKDEDGYPRSVWDPPPPDPANPANSSNWNQDPTEPLESAGQVSYRIGDAWPSDFVDGWTFTDLGKNASPRYAPAQVNPLTRRNMTPVVISPTEWEERSAQATNRGTIETGLGNAVDVAQALLNADPTTTFLNWDLDGDRGMGWPTWVWRDPSVPPEEVEREP